MLSSKADLLQLHQGLSHGGALINHSLERLIMFIQVALSLRLYSALCSTKDRFVQRIPYRTRTWWNRSRRLLANQGSTYQHEEPALSEESMI